MRHWYTRYRISNAVDQGTLTAALARGHAARCTSCQRFARDLHALHARLCDAASTAPVPGRAAARPSRWWLGAAPFALAAAAVAAITLGARDPAPPARDPVAVVQVRGGGSPITRVRDAAAQVSAVLASASTPLDVELRALIHDGRRGLGAVLATGGLRSE
jgi:hypothetical protein